MKDNAGPALAAAASALGLEQHAPGLWPRLRATGVSGGCALELIASPGPEGVEMALRVRGPSRRVVSVEPLSSVEGRWGEWVKEGLEAAQ